MNFIYPFYPTYHPIPSEFYSLISHQQQQLQPTTILISTLQTSLDSAQKNDYLEQVLQTQASTYDQLSPSEAKKITQVTKKAISEGI